MHTRTKNISLIGSILAISFLAAGLLHSELYSLFKVAAYGLLADALKNAAYLVENQPLLIAFSVYINSLVKSGALLATMLAVFLGIYFARRLTH